VRFGAVMGLVAALPLGGCQGWQSALDTHAAESTEIKHLFFVFLGVAVAVWTAVMVMLVAALLRRRAQRPDPLDIDTNTERRAGVTIFTCAIATTVIVLILSVLSYLSQNTVFAKSHHPVSVEVIGHQWWWEIKYDGATPDQGFTTANEIRVPVGVPVRVQLETRDVIHSFWVPSLNGKMDLINGQTNEIEFKADRPGVYRGQCAEFCGLEHALMAFEVIALPDDQYDAWRSQQVKPARVADQVAGDIVFRSKGCALCHTIRGTSAGGKVGPDLTHVGSRQTIGAGTLPMTPGNLAGWIADPQHIKPGNKMPAVPLGSKDLNTLVSYLEALK
jgi:cytochrome c oxidase subunit II